MYYIYNSFAFVIIIYF